MSSLLETPFALFDRALTVGLYVGCAGITPADRRFNCSILAQPDGSVCGRYPKVHLRARSSRGRRTLSIIGRAISNIATPAFAL
jgi:predicted amidohydrolase